jgi:sulfatase maturation enzyme AslB (radical SAM superfamily)
MNKPKSRLEITTVSKCIMDCTFCPQQAFQSNYRGCDQLDLENFKKVLSKIPKDVEIHFSGFAEPFLNPQCMDMIEYAHAEGFEIFLYSTLVGLKTAEVERLKNCNPKLVLHLPDNLGNTKIPITETFMKTLVKVFQTLRVDEFSVMNANFVSNERAGLCPNSPERKIRGWFYCSKLISPQFVMLPNCDIVLCCMDFGLKHRLGNLLEMSYAEIVDSSEFRNVRLSRFRRGNYSLCKRCAWAIPLHQVFKNDLSKKINKLLGVKK